MKLKALLEPYYSDFCAILDATGTKVSEQDHGKTGLLFMWELLHVARCNRAFDDSHPNYWNGRWTRFLPCDYTPYGAHYDEPYNADDRALDTLLRELKKRLLERETKLTNR